jgi:hypothetical protein
MKKICGILLLLPLFLFLTSCDDEDTPPDFAVIANAGPDQEVETGQEVLLDGTNSVDESGQGVNVEWSFVSMPDGSNASIQNPASIVARFVPDVEGTYVTRLTISNEHGSDSDEATVTATAGAAGDAVEITGNITGNMVLERVTPAGVVDYIVTSNIDVSSQLVVEPGVIVEFRADAGMRILQEGSIRAVGTAQDSIIFRGTIKVPGHWRGLRIDSNNPENELAYMALLHGGSDGIGGSVSERSRRGNLIIMSDGIRLKAHNMLLADGSEHGLYVHSVSNVTIELSQNIYTRNARPAYVDVHMFHLLDGESDYTGNQEDYIASADDRTITSSSVWPSLNVPFELPGVTVDSDLEIRPGARFHVRNGKGILVRPDGSFNAAGEETNPIIFRGRFDVRGHWNGIRITSNNPSNRLEYVEIWHGGQGGLGATVSERNRQTSLMLDENARVRVANTTISQSQNYPFWIRGGGNMNIEFTSNAITGNEHAGWVDARFFHVLDESSSFDGNDTDRITSGENVTITQDRTWKKINVPYALPQVTFTSGTLTVEAGANFEANDDGYIYINENAAIRVLGEENDPVEFRGRTSVRGAWRGIRIRTNNPQNSLSHMILRNGGQLGIGATVSERNRVTSLMLDENVTISVDNLAIHDSREYAFWIRHDNNLDISFSNNTFSGNEKLAMVDARYFHVLDGASSYSGNDDDVIRSEANTTASGNIRWDKLDVPYELPNIVAVEGDLEIEAGARFVGNNDGGLDILETGSIRAVGTPDEKIEFTGGVNSAGHWRGINVRSSNSGNEISHFVIRHSGGNGFCATFSDRSRRQAVQVWGGFLRLSDGEISHGTGDGVRAHAGGVVEISNVSFESIDGENQVGF